VYVGGYVLPCAVHGHDDVELFTARMPLVDADIDCREGRQILFVEPDAIAGLDLTPATRALYPSVLSRHPA
jgi:8-oxo-dGTP diphosphatase